MAKGRLTRQRKITSRVTSRHALKRVRLLAMDVNGELSDAGMYYSESVHGEGEIV